MAGCDMANGLASSITVSSPSARRARIARRVGSESAAKVLSRLYIATRLYNFNVIFKQPLHMHENLLHGRREAKIGKKM